MKTMDSLTDKQMQTMTKEIDQPIAITHAIDRWRYIIGWGIYTMRVLRKSAPIQFLLLPSSSLGSIMTEFNFKTYWNVHERDVHVWGTPLRVGGKASLVAGTTRSLKRFSGVL